MYIYLFSFRFFSHVDYHRLLGRVLCTTKQVLVGQPFHVPSVHMPVQTPSPSQPPSPVPFGNHKFVFKVCESVSFLQINSFVALFLDSTYKRYHGIFVFFCLTLLSMIISRSIHVSVDGIISFFSMVE